ncbi:class I SAM-dependent methyltransferase [Undibacterium cyanobacteriorum]|uniref:Class I SAM-dependent methyltransferase n=1 Tax=Undibacterium cyanobacteriorum TaxID=3073561 RepID=A0ABY9RMN9_9BURK|nr:class I SAM-dependent methyltransferase [Undibacterium sp. 20NA77.5]WMW82231.1 class I SAM-dependent methyltransferase [Undibacterium sp. 20NA77.5]
MKCRHCANELHASCLDLGTAPPSNSYLSLEQLSEPELYFPLRLLFCDQCYLVQTEDFTRRELLFSEDYAYFSSYSSSWLEHARKYVSAVCERFALDQESLVVEVAANDGYLLQYVQQRNIPCLGIEPTESTAQAARAKGIRVESVFFGVASARELAGRGLQADLMVANNVLAHVPDINDFVAGFAVLLKENGVVTFEFPHLLNLVRFNQFDTVYHEHFSYLSLSAVQNIFSANGLNVFDVEELSTHGGSLRVYAQKSYVQPLADSVERVLELERSAGIHTAHFYQDFQAAAEGVKNALIRYLIDCKSQGLKVAAYGAAAKGNTLLNFAGIRHDLLSFVVDKNPQKQTRFLPGSRIRIEKPEAIEMERPDRVLILPWNLENEICDEMAFIRSWGAKFVLAVPHLREI